MKRSCLIYQGKAWRNGNGRPKGEVPGYGGHTLGRFVQRLGQNAAGKEPFQEGGLQSSLPTNRKLYNARTLLHVKRSLLQEVEGQ